MALDGLDRRRAAARRRLAVAVVAAVTVVGGAVAAVVVIVGGGGSTDDARPPSPSPSRTSSGPTVQPTTAGGVTLLPAPTRVVGGVPMGYPHTDLGAVSSAARYFEVLDLLDPSAAQQQAQVIAQPGFGPAMGVQAQTAAQRLRQAVGLPPDGTSDNANYYARQARAFKIATSSADRVTVWLLMDDTTSAKGVVNSATTVQGAAMVWGGGDWRMAMMQQMGTAPPTVSPDTPQARQEGWQALAYEKK